jgi:hypothetical protein
MFLINIVIIAGLPMVMRHPPLSPPNQVTVAIPTVAMGTKAL